MRFATASTHRLPTSGNCSEVFFSGKDFRDKLLNSIKNAKKFIHFEYFIFRPDEEGRLVLEELTKAVQRGVEVRLLFDAAGCWKMHSKRTRDFKKAGGKVGWFFPLNPISSPMSMNLRNHRKISIFDGSSAFTGGLNLANEYLRETDDAGVRWLDGHMFLQGPCVEGLSEVFAEDWMTATTEDLSEREEFFFPKIEPAGDEVIQIVESGPDQTAPPLRGTDFQRRDARRQERPSGDALLRARGVHSSSPARGGPARRDD
jgi:cardiolipin synthase